MPIFEVTAEGLKVLEPTSFADQGIREREDLQQFLKHQIEIVAPDTLVISEEFSRWSDSRRRIDLLAIDKEACLVVIELKRTEDGGHMELQALRYASMVSTMTFEQAVDEFQRHLESTERGGVARELILEFLDWDSEDEEEFGQDVRIVLVSGEFSKEITTTVLWLNQKGLDIRCVRLRPYRDGPRTLVDIQQIVPLPEAEEYQVQMQHKVRSEQVSRKSNRDFTKYHVMVRDKEYRNLPKRWAVYRVVKGLFEAGVAPGDICAAVPWRRQMMRVIDGELRQDELEIALAEQQQAEGNKPSVRRYFTQDEELMRHEGRTYVLTNQWGRYMERAVNDVLEAFPDHGIACRRESEG